MVLVYVRLFFVPHPSKFNMDYDFLLSPSLFDPLTTVLAGGVIIGVMGYALYWAQQERLLSFCILWFFRNLALESSVIPLEIIVEHRTYLPSMCLSLLVVMCAFRYITC